VQLSIIIPAYNEELRLPSTLVSINEYISSSFKEGEVEVIVVSDGSTDQTERVVKEAGYPFLKLLAYKKNRGKGFALRYGALESKGALVLINDADGSTPIREFDRLKTFINEGADVVIGSRAMASAETKVKTVWYRKFIGRTFATIVNFLIVPGIADTQCGFKLFTRKAAEELFGRQRSEKFSFDVELLYLANRLGFKIKEVSVNWTNTPGSKVNLVKDSIAMLLDIFRFRWMAICGIYDNLIDRSLILPRE
jgi:dolichyl-phosphate beta-glucosyltransferase